MSEVVFFKADEDLIDLAQEIKDMYHPDLSDVRIGFLYRSEAMSSGGRVIFGKASKVSKQMESLVELDFIIWIAQDVWMGAGPQSRRAMLDYLLCACRNEDDKLKIAAPDFEGYYANIQRFGMWTNALQLMERTVLQKQLPGFETLKAQGARATVVAVDPAMITEEV